MEKTDIVVIGASFSGLTFGHYLPNSYKTVILDRKKRLDSAIETTGLITQATKDLLADFVDVEKYLPNHINTIAVVSPNYDKHFFSHTDDPWIYSTDTPQLVKHMSETLPEHIDLRLGSSLISYGVDEQENYPVLIKYTQNGEKKEIRAKFIIGADGVNSTVARNNKNLSENKKLLLGYEKVFYGDITFGDHSENTVYHFWFGKFSLGYGGWLSPTIINGKKAFRLGLAKLDKNKNDLKRLEDFIRILKEKNIIKIDEEQDKCVIAFGHHIPIGGVLSNVFDNYSMLIGDAAGFCGAFAADGIKGTVVSGKAAAKLVPKYLQGDKTALEQYFSEIQNYNKLMRYYKKQQLYRFLWNRMKSDNSFHALYNLIAKQKDSFLYQFCDSKDRHKSLIRVVLRINNIPQLFHYSWCLFLDLFRFRI